MKKILLIFFTAAILLSFGCSKGEKPATTNSNDMGMERRAVYGDAAIIADQLMSSPMPVREAYAIHDQIREDEAAAGGSGNLNEVERKLVKRANVRIRVENLDAADKSVNELMEQYDAYAASTNIDENSRNYSLRVPSHFYDVFLVDMNGMGRLLNRYESTEDVTIRYYDLEGRLETKKELLKTFQAYLGRARTIEEIMAVEARISELQYDIEGTGMQLRNLANRVDYATIDLTLLGPATVSPVKSVTLSERLKLLFTGFGGFLSTVAVVLLGIVIYGIPSMAIVVLLFWLLFGKVGLARKLWGVIKK